MAKIYFFIISPYTAYSKQQLTPLQFSFTSRTTRPTHHKKRTAQPCLGNDHSPIENVPQQPPHSREAKARKSRFQNCCCTIPPGLFLGITSTSSKLSMLCERWARFGPSVWKFLTREGGNSPGLKGWRLSEYNIYSSSEKPLQLSRFPLSLLTKINQKWKC